MTNEETENLITDLSKGDYSADFLSDLYLAIRQLRTDRADEAWNDAVEACQEAFWATSVICSIEDQKILQRLEALKRPTRPNPEPKMEKSNDQ